MNVVNKFDFIIFGASGFTGKLVVEYALEKYTDDKSVSWAIAGRNETKLHQLKDEMNIPDDVGIFIVESDDQNSIEEMLAQTKCVLTTVGPYQLYGEKLIRSCIASGTDYVDLCGGFDSIPFDLGVFLVQEEVMSKIGKYAPSVRGRVRAMNGEFSGGTAASMKATMSSLKTNPELINVLINPHGLCEGINGAQQEDDTKPKYDEELDVWVAPFFMAPINTKNIHRSIKLMNHIYGKDFLYNEMWITGPGEEGKAAAEMLAGNNPIAGDDVPAPGEGPSREKRENGNCDMDPGYGSTSKMITESAICLVKDAKELEGGIYTPAAALGNKLISRLEANAGLTFIIE